MRKTKEQIWNMFEKICKDMKSSDDRIQFHGERKQDFFDKFQKLYDDILNNFMDVENGITTLDRHKVTAIITISGIQSNFVSIEPLEEGKVFLGNEIISLSVALSFMQAALNMELQKVGINKTISKFLFPKALACKTDYFDIMARNLYYSQKYWEMNPLELSEKFFLLEYITLEKNGIDSECLRNVN